MAIIVIVIIIIRIKAKPVHPIIYIKSYCKSKSNSILKSFKEETSTTNEVANEFQSFITLMEKKEVLGIHFEWGLKIFLLRPLVDKDVESESSLFL